MQFPRPTPASVSLGWVTMSNSVPRRLADGLTLARFPIAMTVFVMFERQNLAWAGLFLVLGWFTDFWDGRLARFAPGSTRLGPFDVVADVVLASGVGLGLVESLGSSLAVTIVASGVLAAALHGNHSPAMLFISGAYGAGIWVILAGGVWSGSIVIGGLIAIFVLDFDRLVRELIPAFFFGLGLGRGRGHDQRPHRVAGGNK